MSQLLHVDPNPYVQFALWFNEACELMPARLVNAMTLATVSRDNKPSARIVLLKEFDERGFTFFTNYHSQKGQHIAYNPNVSLSFWWETLERQVRIEGQVEKISPESSDLYFQSRSKNSQIAAVASQQSQVLSKVEDLQSHYQLLISEFAAADSLVHRPPHWGGYIVKPERFEFWQGRENRLHDRFYYFLDNGQWRINRLFP